MKFFYTRFYGVGKQDENKNFNPEFWFTNLLDALKAKTYLIQKTKENYVYERAYKFLNSNEYIMVYENLKEAKPIRDLFNNKEDLHNEQVFQELYNQTVQNKSASIPEFYEIVVSNDYGFDWSSFGFYSNLKLANKIIEKHKLNPKYTKLTSHPAKNIQFYSSFEEWKKQFAANFEQKNNEKTLEL